MKKITVDQARELLKQGIHPKCEVSRDMFEPVKSTADIERFLSLSSYQGCQFYGYEQEEIESFKVPDYAAEISVDEATDMLVSGEKIFAQIIGENEQCFSNLGSFVTFFKKCDFHGDTYILYWRG